MRNKASLSKQTMVMLVAAVIVLALVLLPTVFEGAFEETVAGQAISIDASDCGTILNTVSETYSLTEDMDCRSYGGHAITINANNVVLDCNDNKILGPGSGLSYGIWIDYADSVEIRNCGVEDYAVGIYILGSDGGVFEDNLLENTAEGIRIGGGSDNFFGDNVVSESTMNGFHLLNGASNNVFEDNVVSGSVIYGFHLDSGSNDNLFEGNTISDSGDGGIYFDESSGNTFERNFVLDSGDYGINLNLSDENILESNKISGSGLYGITLESSSDNEISNNEVCEDVVDNFYCDSSNGTVGSGNYFYLGGDITACSDNNFPIFDVEYYSCSDFDGDGYYSSVDCDDGDASINPGAIEICDGVDNDCDGDVDELCIQSCGFSIDDAGEYVLVNDLSCSSDAITIDSEDVSLDCEGYSIEGDFWDSGTNMVGLSVSSYFQNVSISNCNISNFRNGINLQGNNTSLESNIIYENLYGLAVNTDESSFSAIDNVICNYGMEDITCNLGTIVASGQGNFFESISGCLEEWDGDNYECSEYLGSELDSDEDSYSNDLDCDNSDADVNPGATEMCDGVDNDCDGYIDESDAVDASTWYADLDGDLYGDASSSVNSCEETLSGYVSDSSDCDDGSGDVNPGATEMCDDVDNDCDGDIDNGIDCTEYSSLSDQFNCEESGGDWIDYFGVEQCFGFQDVSCGEVISSAGDYILRESCEYSGTNGIEVTVSDVTLFCEEGVEIKGTGVSSSYGILVSGSAPASLENIEIIGCGVSDFEEGIYLYYVDSSTVYGNILENLENGIHLVESSSNEVYENEVSTASSNGIYLANGLGNNVHDNFVSDSGYGMTIVSDENTLSDNEIYSNEYGFFIRSSEKNVFDSNKACNNEQDDFYCYDSFLNAGDNNDFGYSSDDVNLCDDSWPDMSLGNNGYCTSIDLNLDGSVDESDELSFIGYLMDYFGIEESDVGYDDLYDINSDGSIDFEDVKDFIYQYHSEDE